MSEQTPSGSGELLPSNSGGNSPEMSPSGEAAVTPSLQPNQGVTAQTSESVAHVSTPINTEDARAAVEDAYPKDQPEAQPEMQQAPGDGLPDSVSGTLRPKYVSALPRSRRFSVSQRVDGVLDAAKAVFGKKKLNKPEKVSSDNQTALGDLRAEGSPTPAGVAAGPAPDKVSEPKPDLKIETSVPAPVLAPEATPRPDTMTEPVVPTPDPEKVTAKPEAARAERIDLTRLEQTLASLDAHMAEVADATRNMADAAKTEKALYELQLKAQKDFEEKKDKADKAEQDRLDAENPIKQWLRANLKRKPEIDPKVPDHITKERAERASATVAATREYARLIARALRSKGIDPHKPLTEAQVDAVNAARSERGLTVPLKESEITDKIVLSPNMYREPEIRISHGVKEFAWKDTDRTEKVFMADARGWFPKGSTDPNSHKFPFTSGIGVTRDGVLVEWAFGKINVISDKQSLGKKYPDKDIEIFSQDPLEMLRRSTSRAVPGNDTIGQGYLAIFNYTTEKLDEMYQNLTGEKFEI